MPRAVSSSSPSDAPADGRRTNGVCVGDASGVSNGAFMNYSTANLVMMEPSVYVPVSHDAVADLDAEDDTEDSESEDVR